MLEDTAFRLSATANSVYSQLHSISEGLILHPQPEDAPCRVESNALFAGVFRQQRHEILPGHIRRLLGLSVGREPGKSDLRRSVIFLSRSRKLQSYYRRLGDYRLFQKVFHSF
jgi:hypothetical protein